MLVNINNMLESAYKKGYAVGAYNINNLEWTKWILEACNEDNSPVILSVSPTSANYFGGYDVVINLVKSLIKDLNIKIDVSLHLDHAKDVETCKKAIDAGFRSVMIDASNKPLEENIRIVNDVVAYAKQYSAFVEAELGSIDGEVCSYDESGTFVQNTGIDFFAPAVGNRHGVYDENPNIDFELLGSISKLVKIPIVLHGASGLDENKIKTAIFCGVSKININTELQLEWTKKVREYLNNNPDEYDPRKIIASGREAIKNLIHEKNVIFGCNNRAN